MASGSERRRTIEFSSPCLLDGAMGTELLRHGWEFGTCLETWAAQHPEVVEQTHRAYIAAGADVIHSCTFGGSRPRLEAFGAGGRIAELNATLAGIAVATKTGCTRVAGNIGPTGRSRSSGGDLDAGEMEAAFAEQATCLAKAGVDYIAVETMTDLKEASAAIAAVLAATALPVTVTLSFDDNGRLKDGAEPEDACRELQGLGAAAVGCNCWPCGDALCRIVERMSSVAEVPLIARPSAGLPENQDGRSVYPLDAVGFASLVRRLLDVGAAVVGGCCGTTPEYIRLLRSLIDRR